MTSNDIALLLNDDYKHVNSVIRKYINLLRKKGEIRQIGKELGMLDYGTLNVGLLEKIIAAGNENILTYDEKKYAKRMGWIK
ncbi:hypothetical protein R2R35_19725 [Anaerocolumna sp. AGMB13020]|uniref:hypothetical protein n=1 Tax=Anaerocolumna sp. AGMB13020 TaxID=3081750 RepID=UPI0029538881|nr:hypothetical protein [Anaerocolumna sp. AGMB13020]WOO36002.1 hypothetical protein R2R35_19725 [Anaerocolumna sp. AGMB13020]